MGTYFHSVTLDESKCRGCTNCIKGCPTEAIRVRKSKARIINERCIDCGECIRACPHHAKKAITDPFDTIYSYEYRIAIPAPSLYSQFKTAKSREQLLTALKRLDFDDVYEVAKAAEIVSSATRKLLKTEELKKPLISSACPAVVRLIQVRFPNLIENIVKIDSPMEVAAKIAKKNFLRKNNVNAEQVGVFFISPCAAKVTSVKAPFGNEKSNVDGVISIRDIYLRMINSINKVKENESFELAGIEGVRWANSGGESAALATNKYLAVDGIHNVIKIFEEIENDRLADIDFVEALACTGGCLGGPLAVENVYVAKTRLKKFLNIAEIKESNNRMDKERNEEAEEYDDIIWKMDVQHKPILKLDDDFEKAIKKLESLEKIDKELPGLDCGACGAPNCRALAEDIVRGIANETDCIFLLRQKVRALAMQMMELEAKMPPVMDREHEDGK